MGAVVKLRAARLGPIYGSRIGIERGWITNAMEHMKMTSVAIEKLVGIESAVGPEYWGKVRISLRTALNASEILYGSMEHNTVPRERRHSSTSWPRKDFNKKWASEFHVLR
jgi:hypothetical protein